MISVVIVAGVRLYEDGLAKVLGDDEGFEVAATAAGLGQALVRMRQLANVPHVVLLDIGQDDGVEALRAFRDEFPGVQVVALAIREVEEDVIMWAEAGVAGFVVRDASIADLKATLECVARGETLCSPRLAATLLRRVAALSQRQLETKTNLTTREREIAGLLEEGRSNKEIAGRLGIELSTVKNHVHNILEKLQVRGRGEAAAVLRGTRGSGSS